MSTKNEQLVSISKDLLLAFEGMTKLAYEYVVGDGGPDAKNRYARMLDKGTKAKNHLHNLTGYSLEKELARFKKQSKSRHIQ